MLHRNSKGKTRDEDCETLSGNVENLQDDSWFDCCIIDVKKKGCDSACRNSVKTTPQKVRSVEGNKDDLVLRNYENGQDNGDCYIIDPERERSFKQTAKERKISAGVESDFSRRNSCGVMEDEEECYVVFDSELSRTNGNIRTRVRGESCVCSSEEAKDKFISSIISKAYSDPQARQILAVQDGNNIEHDLDMEEATLDFQPCFLHQLHCSVSYISPSREQELIAQGIPVRTGKYTKGEDRIIFRNWNNFVEKYQIDNPVALLGIYRGYNSVLKKFCCAKKLYLQLGKDLNDRTLHSIYERARKLLDVWNYRGPFSVEDKEKLLKLHSRLGNQWRKIAVLMNRPAALCSPTIRRLLSSSRKGAWTTEEDSLLIKSVKRHVGRKKWMTKFRMYPWSKIAKDVHGRNEVQCRKRWLTYLCWKPKLFVQPKWKKRDNALLIYFLYLFMVEEESFIDWDMLYEKFKTSVSSYVSLQFKWYSLKYKVPDFASKDHESIVIYLYKNHLPKILESCKITMSDLDHMKILKS